ncbi:MAG: PilZ domain-containing protein [Candidatus Eremiobacteraeota bacterium]|nr:PilZ domain-containing protein [Candidatus Eremiobacteraeota bacterium]
MLGGLADWFANRGANRRENPRTTSAYRVSYSTNGLTWSPAIGVDISTGGISVLLQKGLHKDEADFKLHLGGRDIPCRMSVIRHEGAHHNGVVVHKYALKFAGIKSDDYDAISRWIKGATSLVEQPHLAKEQLAAIRMNPDDVARLFPKAIQDRLHHELIKRKRLGPIKPGHTPLVAYYYSGPTETRGKRIHKLTIESKVVQHHHEDRFKTRFQFDDNADEIIVLD